MGPWGFAHSRRCCENTREAAGRGARGAWGVAGQNASAGELYIAGGGTSGSPNNLLYGVFDTGLLNLGLAGLGTVTALNDFAVAGDLFESYLKRKNNKK